MGIGEGKKSHGISKLFSSYNQVFNITSCPCLFTSFKPFRKNIIAPRGPRNDLWVVVVTTSANSNGLGITFAATRPLMCAMSAKRIAFCLSHTYIPEKYLLKWMWKRFPQNSLQGEDIRIQLPYASWRNHNGVSMHLHLQL